MEEWGSGEGLACIIGIQTDLAEAFITLSKTCFSENSAPCVVINHKSYKVGRLSLQHCGQRHKSVGMHA